MGGCLSGSLLPAGMMQVIGVLELPAGEEFLWTGPHCAWWGLPWPGTGSTAVGASHSTDSLAGHG